MEGKLVKLIEALERVAPHVWETAVRQAVLEGWIAVIGVVVGLVMVCAVYPLGKAACCAKPNSGVETGCTLGAIGSGIAGLAIAIIGFAHIPMLFNPDFYALQALMGMMVK
jgi:hypothetical protein